MKKNAKILIGSGAGIAVLGVAVLALVLTKPGEEVESATSSDDNISLLSYDADDISTLTIKNENGEYTINRLGSEKWGIDSIPADYANSSAYSSAMSSAGSVSASRLVEENAAELDKYGFDDPTAVFSMTFKDDKYEDVECAVGLKFEGENSWYFKTDKSSDVYLVSNSALKFAMGDVLDYVQISGLTDAYDKDNDVVNRIRVERTDLENDLVLDLLPEETEKEFSSTYVAYKMSSHNDILADDELDMDVVYGLFGLNATGAAVVNPTDEEKKKFGFDNPSCVVTMVKNEEDVVKLTVGAPIYATDSETGGQTQAITGYYGMISGKDVIYMFSTDSLPYMTVTPESILYRLFLTPYIYYLNDVTLKDSDGKEYKFEITGDASNGKVTYNGKEIELDLFKSFYQYLLSSYAEEIYLEDLTEDNKFIAGFTYNYREEGKAPDTVEVYSSESDRTCIFVVNGDVRYKVRQLYGTRLLENIDALLNGGTIKSEF